MPMPISDGVIEVGDVCARVSDNAIGVYEGIYIKMNVRLDSDASLVALTPAEIRLPTPAEIVTRNEATTLADAQAANDAAAAALTAAGGDPCPA